jgi:hypothetical protein
MEGPSPFRRDGPSADSCTAAKWHLCSITSSARPSSQSGMGRPSVLAILRLMTNSTFTACWTVRPVGSAPLRNLAGIDAGLAICIGKTGSVAHQAAGRGELTQRVNRRQRVARLPAYRSERWRGSYHHQQSELLLVDVVRLALRPRALDFCRANRRPASECEQDEDASDQNQHAPAVRARGPIWNQCNEIFHAPIFWPRYTGTLVRAKRRRQVSARTGHATAGQSRQPPARQHAQRLAAG